MKESLHLLVAGANERGLRNLVNLQWDVERFGLVQELKARIPFFVALRFLILKLAREKLVILILELSRLCFTLCTGLKI